MVKLEYSPHHGFIAVHIKSQNIREITLWMVYAKPCVVLCKLSKLAHLGSSGTVLAREIENTILKARAVTVYCNAWLLLNIV